MTVENWMKPSTTYMSPGAGQGLPDFGITWGILTKSFPVRAETLQTNPGHVSLTKSFNLPPNPCFSIFKKENLLYRVALRVRDNTNKTPNTAWPTENIQDSNNEERDSQFKAPGFYTNNWFLFALCNQGQCSSSLTKPLESFSIKRTLTEYEKTHSPLPIILLYNNMSFCFALPFFFFSSEKRVAFYITVLFWEAVFPESCNHSRRKVEKLINLLVNQKRKTDYS